MKEVLLGQRLREFRIKKGLTQCELADGICTPSMISQIEANKAHPSHRVLKAIAGKLEQPLEMLMEDVVLNLEYNSTFKLAMAFVSSQEYGSAIPLLKKLLESSRIESCTLDTKLNLSICYLNTGRLEDAVEILVDLKRRSLESDNKLMLAKVLFETGMVEFIKNRVNVAVFEWKNAIENIRMSDKKEIILEAKISYHLGQAMSKQGYISESIEYLTQAATIYASFGTNNIGQVYMDISKSYKQINDINKAVEYSEKASFFFETAQNKLMGQRLQVSLAILKVKSGLLDEAVKMLEGAVLQFRVLDNSEEEGAALVELAEIRFKQNDLSLAEETCSKAKILLPALHIGQARVHRLRGQIFEKSNMRENALSEYKKAADCFKHFNEVSEWDKTMFEMAQLYNADGEHTRAFKIIEQTRQYIHDSLESRGIVL